LKITFQFFKIINIFHHFENKFEYIFICQELIAIQYDSHYKACVVETSNNHTYFSLSEIVTCFPLNTHILQDGKTYVNIITK